MFARRQQDARTSGLIGKNKVLQTVHSKSNPAIGGRLFLLLAQCPSHTVRVGKYRCDNLEDH